MVWGETDWNLKVGEFDASGSEPRVTNIREIVRCDDKFKVYHVDFSPDGRHIAFQRGRNRQVDLWSMENLPIASR